MKHFTKGIAAALASLYLAYSPLVKADQNVDKIEAFLYDEPVLKKEREEQVRKVSESASQETVKTSSVGKTKTSSVSLEEENVIEKLFDGKIEEKEMEFSTDYVWYYAYHTIEDKRKYGRFQGVEIAGSNQNRDFWLRVAFLNGKNEDVGNDYRVHAQILMVPFQYCFNQHIGVDPIKQCNNTMTRLSLEARLGVGVGLHILKSSTKLLPKDSNAVQFVGNPDIPHLEFPSDFHILTEAVGRVGLVEGKIGVSYGELGFAWYVGSGARF